MPPDIPPDSTPEITPFRIQIPDAALADLQRRLAATRWPEAQTVADWQQGVPLAWLQDICRHWQQDYDWRAREARLNRWPQFRTEIDGLGVHFIHVRSPHAGARPLLMTHGWPGSMVEFQQVIAPLTEPTAFGGEAADAFHLVCPTLPGYGFSDKPTQPGWGVERIADAWHTLMQRLGYARYFAQGGDWGAAVTTQIGLRHAGPCAGIHLNMALVAPDKATLADPSPAEQRALAALKHYQDWDSGYSQQQRTRPQTLGYGLADSPTGQAAWVLEKFHGWMDCDGQPETVVDRDTLLDNVMLYWLTNSAASSARLYWESFKQREQTPLSLPVGISSFPKDIFLTSRRWAEKRFLQLVYWNELPSGGHFAALEQPEAFVSELRACFRLVT